MSCTILAIEGLSDSSIISFSPGQQRFRRNALQSPIKRVLKLWDRAKASGIPPGAAGIHDLLLAL